MAIKSHVGFDAPYRADAEDVICEHFLGLGYFLAASAGNELVFRRGSKLSAFYRFNVRALETTLRVRFSPGSRGDMRVSCDWEVWTCMNLTTGSDHATLEAEGKQLESLLKESVEYAA